MRIRFIEAPQGRDYKVGQVVEFKGPVEQSYARKFIARGWAEEVAVERKAAVEPEAVKAAPAKPEPVKPTPPPHHDTHPAAKPAAAKPRTGL